MKNKMGPGKKQQSHGGLAVMGKKASGRSRGTSIAETATITSFGARSSPVLTFLFDYIRNRRLFPVAVLQCPGPQPHAFRRLGAETLAFRLFRVDLDAGLEAV